MAASGENLEGVRPTRTGEMVSENADKTFSRLQHLCLKSGYGEGNVSSVLGVATRGRGLGYSPGPGLPTITTKISIGTMIYLARNISCQPNFCPNFTAIAPTDLGFYSVKLELCMSSDISFHRMPITRTVGVASSLFKT